MVLDRLVHESQAPKVVAPTLSSVCINGLEAAYDRSPLNQHLCGGADRPGHWDV